jgi:acyl-CoA synthetase (AMP-forming)/AMP-acid ligase II
MILVPREKIDEYTRAGWWGERTIGEIFLEQAARLGGQLAVADPPNLPQIMGDAAQRWSWQTLLEQVGRHVALLYELGLRKDDVIVVQLPNCVQLHAIYLACAISGIVVSPVPMQYRAHELAYVVSMTQARLAITTARVGSYRSAEQWVSHAHLLPGIRTLCAYGDELPPACVSLNAALARTTAWGAQALREHMTRIALTAHDVFTICWTSGTEARPKGVPRNHNEWIIVGQSVIDAGQLQPGAQMLIPFPFVNMAGMSTSLMAWLLIGAGLHQHHPFDLDVFIEQLRSQPIDYSVAAPAVLNLLLKQPEKMQGVDLSRFKRVGSGGGPVSPWLIEQMAEQFGIEVVNYFGSNEGAALSSSPADMPDRAQRSRYFPRVGVPGFTWKLSNAKKISTRLVDLDTGADILTGGHVGELRFKGPTIFSGYYRAPEQTACAFDEQGYYRTGDLFEIAGDQLQFYRFAGRHKDIVIRGGMNISSEEVESLLQGHPKVRESAVIGCPDPVLGEKVCAVVVPQPGQSVTLEELVHHLRHVEEVAAFKWPERLIVLDELPRNPVGKVLKRDLRARFFPDPEQATDLSAGAA